MPAWLTIDLNPAQVKDLEAHALILRISVDRMTSDEVEYPELRSNVQDLQIGPGDYQSHTRRKRGKMRG